MVKNTWKRCLLLGLILLVLFISVVSVGAADAEMRELTVKRDTLASICELANRVGNIFPDVERFGWSRSSVKLCALLINGIQADMLPTPTESFVAAKNVSTMFDDEISASVAAYQAQLRKAAIREEMARRPGMSGRFVVPSVGIDVAIFYNDLAHWRQAQSLCDAADSASFETWSATPSMIIAEHRSQGFRNLPSVRVGAKARIETGDDATSIDLVCTFVIDGINNKALSMLTTADGTPINGMAPYISYTCHYDYAQTHRIRIVGWEPC